MYILGYIYYLNQTLTGGLAYPATDHVRTGNRSQTPAKRQGGRVPGTGLIGAIRRWRARQAVERELAALSDRTLRDIGIHRGEISEIAVKLTTQDEAKPTHEPSTAGRVQPGRLKLAGCG